MYEVELYHHGIKGQKWGIRRFQDYDGTLKVPRKQYLKRFQGRVDRLNKKSDKLFDKYNSTWTDVDGAPLDPKWDGTLPSNKYSARLDKVNRRLGKAEERLKAEEEKAKPKLYKKTLNTIDKGIAEEKRDFSDAMSMMNKHRDIAMKYKDKADIATEKGKTARAEKLMAKADKYANISNTYRKTAAEHASNIAKGYELTGKYIKKAESDGLKVSSKSVRRNVTRGSEWVLNALSYASSYYTGVAVIGTHHVEGTKYNVRRPKENKG